MCACVCLCVFVCVCVCVCLCATYSKLCLKLRVGQANKELPSTFCKPCNFTCTPTCTHTHTHTHTHTQVGALTAVEFLTPLGAVLCLLPVDPSIGKFLLKTYGNRKTKREGVTQLYSVCIVRWRWNYLHGLNTNCWQHGPHKLPKGDRNNDIKINPGKKSSCEDQGIQRWRYRRETQVKGKSDKVTPLCCSTSTGIQVSHTELSSSWNTKLTIASTFCFQSNLQSVISCLLFANAPCVHAKDACVHAHYFWLGTCKWPLSTCCCFNATLVLYAYIGMFVRMIVRAQQRIAAYSRACDVKMLFLTLPSRFAWTSTTYQCKHTCIQTRILTHALSHPPHLVPFCLEYSATYSASHSASYSDYSASYSDTDWHYISFLC